MKRVINFLAISFLCIGLISCNDDDGTPSPLVTFTATLSGASEVPPVASAFTGTATLTFNTSTKIFTLNLTHNVTTPTMAHIHVGAAGVAGPVVFTLTATSPITYTSAALTATQESDLNLNLYYVNIHTAANAAGEIRGQLIKQ